MVGTEVGVMTDQTQDQVYFTEIFDMTNEEYHKIRDGIGRAYSSSQLKDGLDDLDTFYRKYITKEIPGPKGPALDIGNYVHTAILEPHKLDEEYALYTGGIRSGAKWKAFQAEHEGKIILAGKDIEKAQTAVEGLQRSPLSMEKFIGGMPEVSLFIPLQIADDGEIYVYKNFKGKSQRILKLGADGWVPVDFMPSDKNLIQLVIKVRSDYRIEGMEISDIKTTGGDVSNERKLRAKVRDSKYDLSAALYLDMFNAAAIMNDQALYLKFNWVFSTKDKPQAKTYVAHDDQIKIGRAKWTAALNEVVRMERCGWDVPDSVVEMGVDKWELDEWTQGTRSLPKVLRQVSVNEMMDDCL